MGAFIGGKLESISEELVGEKPFSEESAKERST
jgi:hypothetical protein